MMFTVLAGVGCHSKQRTHFKFSKITNHISEITNPPKQLFCLLSENKILHFVK